MKKYIIYSLLVILVFVILFICYELIFNTSESINTNINNEQLKKDIVELEQQLQDIKSKTDNESNASTKNVNVSSNQIDNFGPPVIYDPIANYDIAKLTDPLVDPRGRSPANQIPTPQIAAQFNFPTQGVIDRYHRVGLLIAIDNNYDDNTSNSSRSSRSTFSPNPAFDDSSSNYSYQATGYSNPKQYMNSLKYKNKKNKKDKKDKKLIKGMQDINTSLETFASYQDDNAILELIGKKIANEWYRYFTSISMGNKVIKVNVDNKNRRELYTGDIVYIKELNRKYRVEIDKMDNIEYNPYFF